MRVRNFFPFSKPIEMDTNEKDPIVDPARAKKLNKAMKVVSLALGMENTFLSSLRDKRNYEPAPYDFERIQKAIDTDSYAKRAFAHYKELFWKEGWEIAGENQKAIDYLYQRFDFMEISMGKPFSVFLKEVVDNLTKFHNVFIVKSRGPEIRRAFPGRLRAIEEDQDPILGYYILPTEKIHIKRDKYNNPISYRQSLDDDNSFISGSNTKEPTWDASEVIHLSLDRKPGRAFGTPFLTAALDDLVSLRQVEEDVLNLIHRDLFPLFKYQVGTDEFPAIEGEVQEVAADVESLRTEGAIVMTHRHNVEVIGSEGKALDTSKLIPHFKERVAVGLGIYPHHLGMVGNGLTQDATDRLDVMLYDRVKSMQREYAEYVRLLIFDELLREGGFDPMINPRDPGISDRCTMKFREIDKDTQVKAEAHEINKFSSNVIDVVECRLALGIVDDYDEDLTFAAISARILERYTPTPVVAPSSSSSSSSPAKKAAPKSTKPNAAPSSKGGLPNPKSKARGNGNIIRPSNQHGTRLSPNIRRSEDELNINEAWLDEVVDLIDDKDEEV